MKTLRLIVFLIFLLLPIAGRTLYYYQGTYRAPAEVPVPDYASLTLSKPVLSTPAAGQPAAAAAKTGPVIVFDQAHSNTFLLGEIEPFIRQLKQQGGRLEMYNTDGDLLNTLKYAASFVVLNPTMAYNAYENQAIQNFVQRGGRLLVIADPTRDYYNYENSAYLTSSDVANLLLNPYGISFTEDYVYNLVENEANFRNVYFKQFDKESPITAGLNALVFYSAHSLKTTQKALVTGDDNTLSSSNDQPGKLPVAAASNDGRVLALGDMTFMNGAYVQIADNQRLVQNITTFLLAAAPERDLRSFPHLFTRPVVILAPKDKPLTQSFISTTASLQQLLRSVQLDISLAEEPAAGKDLIVMGTYPPDKDIEPFVKDFKIDFSGVTSKPGAEDKENKPADMTATPTPVASGTPTAEPTPDFSDLLSTPSDEEDVGETFVVPGFGKVPTNGTALILFSPSAERNTLVLLAKDKDTLSELVGLLNSNDLSTCVIQGNLALCKVSESNGDSAGGGYDNYNMPTEPGG